MSENENINSESVNETTETTEVKETVETTKAPEAPKSSNKKMVGIIAGAAGGVVVLGGVVAALVITSSPKYMVANAVENTYKDFQKMDAYQVFNNVANGGSVEVSANLKETGVDLTGSAKIYLDADNIKLGSVIALKDDDDVVADGQVYFSHDGIVLVSESLLEENYGISFKDAKKNLPGSVFDPDEKTDNSMDEQMFENWMNIEETIKGMEGLRKDYDKLGADYRKMFITALCNNSEVTKGKNTVKTADGKINCKTVTFKMDEESFAKSFSEVYEYAKDDKKLEDIITRYAAVASLSSKEDPEDIKDKFYDQLDDFGDSIEDMEDSEIDMEVTFYISGGRVIAVDMTAEDDKDEVTAKLVIGKNIATSKEISFVIEQDNEEMSLVYSVEEDSAKAYNAEIEMTVPSNRGEGDRKMTLSVDWDKKSGDLEAELNADDVVVALEGSIEEDKTVHTMTIDSVTATENGEKQKIDLDLVLVLNEKDKIPATPKFVEILTMDEDDFKDVSEELQKSLEKISKKYGKSAPVDDVVEDEY